MKMDKQKGLSWREQLEMETGFHFRTVNPEEIEKESFLTIKKELGEALNPAVGKSGVNHRLRKLGAVAEELRQQAARDS